MLMVPVGPVSSSDFAIFHDCEEEFDFTIYCDCEEEPDSDMFLRLSGTSRIKAHYF